ncbi:hypothetical protein [Kribbella sp. CA-247076]|uniref:hypothetical protein n=1 Tax=Kribbella sp. CA-247076 TaxID=3239941 RepID=UPI003D8C3607
MHDIDRALFESETFGEGEEEYQEFGQASESELALASELLEITTEAELDRFLGKLVSGALSAARSFAGSDAGRAVGGVLKSVAKQALPQLGKAVGDVVAPGRGGALGQRAGQWLGSRLELGLQTEGLSAEDEEYEVARAFVRFANETAGRAAQAPPGMPPALAAQRAAVAAAQRHLPGLLRPQGAAGGRGAEGRWIRRGDRIIVLDA